MNIDKGENIGLTLQLIKSDGSVEEGATVTYKIFDSTGTVEKVPEQSAAFNATTKSYIDTLILSVSWPDQIGGSYLIIWLVSNAGDDLNGTYTEDLQVSDFGEAINFIKDMEGGDWKRDGTQMIFYKAGGVEIARFNLFKFDGTPATEQDVEVAERQRV